jgi:large subunit ribosomal protein L14e
MAESKETKKEKLVGRLIVKLAGRDAGQIGVIVEELKDDYVLVDGSVRRRKCNLKHVEILDTKADIKAGATHSDVVSALAKLGVKVVDRKPKVKKAAPAKKEKKAEKKAEKAAKKEAKKAEKKEAKVAKKEAKKKPAKTVTKKSAAKKTAKKNK